MSRRHLACLALLGATGCRAESDAPLPSASATSTAAATTADRPNAQASLDAMDSRIPVPLLPMMANHQKQNMRDHLLVVQEIVRGLDQGDLAAVQASASRFGFSEQMGKMCEHMGSGAAGFTELALKFHHTADTIGAAAKAGDRAGALRALGDTLATCTSCHETYKQHVVDEATWAASRSAATTAHPAH